MSKVDIIRAWRDEEYRRGLSAGQRAALPENPAGLIALSEEDMGSAVGGAFTINCTQFTVRCESICQVFSC